MRMTRDETLTAEEVEGKYRYEKRIEKLKKEAGNWLRKYLLCCNCEKKCNCIDSNSYCEEQVLKAYIDSAEPREKQIEIDARQIRALQNQNGELTDKVKELEAGRPQWHDLRKDPNDLPQKYIPVLNQYGEHRSYDGHYWRDCDDVIYTDVIAWCEVPQFEEIK